MVLTRPFITHDRPRATGHSDNTGSTVAGGINSLAEAGDTFEYLSHLFAKWIKGFKAWSNPFPVLSGAANRLLVDRCAPYGPDAAATSVCYFHLRGDEQSAGQSRGLTAWLVYPLGAISL